jgi:cholesterol transport system auxiliary component
MGNMDMKFQFKHAFKVVCAVALIVTVAGCAQRQTGQSITVYDMGLGVWKSPTHITTEPSVTGSVVMRPPLLLHAIQTTRALDSSALYYRLLYSDPLQPKPYAQARWSMPPAELLEQQLRYRIGAQRHVIHPQEHWQLQPGAMQLQLHLDELSHVFETPDKSYGLLKLRATLSIPHNKGARLIAQRSFTVTHPSVTPDAAGGVRALHQAVEQLALELDAWILFQSTLTQS